MNGCKHALKAHNNTNYCPDCLPVRRSAQIRFVKLTRASTGRRALIDPSNVAYIHEMAAGCCIGFHNAGEDDVVESYDEVITLLEQLEQEEK